MRDQRTKGFSLIELMVAVVVLTVTLIGVSRLFSSSLLTDSDSRTSTAAATIAETRIEMLKSAGFAGITNGDTNTTVDHVTYNCSWAITDAVANTLKKIVVTVTWGNPARQVVVSTYMAKQ